jgi:hypothetical protein
MKMAIHQPNLCPWLSFFRKMHLADKFCLMSHCQFEKNGWTNRFKWKDKWFTLPVKNGMDEIFYKQYMNLYPINDVNIPLIIGFARMFGIDTRKIVFDRPTFVKGTDRLIEICQDNDCDEYLTNPSDYLEPEKFEKAGIKIVPYEPTNDYKVNLFDALERWGIEGVGKMICRR